MRGRVLQTAEHGSLRPSLPVLLPIWATRRQDAPTLGAAVLYHLTVQAEHLGFRESMSESLRNLLIVSHGTRSHPRLRASRLIWGVVCVALMLAATAARAQE